MKNDHKTYRPCKNFSNKVSENKCTWNDKCDYNHETLNPGTLQCWDCGDTFNSKDILMIHRKNNHKVPMCKKIKEFKGCDKSDDNFWYFHIPQTQQNDQIETSVTNVITPDKQQDFCTVTKKKPIPTSVIPEPPMRTEIILMEMMKIMKEQHKATMDMLLSWTTKINQMNQVAPPSQQ